MACAIAMDLGIRIGPGQLAASDEFSEVRRHRTDVVRYQRRPVMQQREPPGPPYTQG